MGYILLMVIAVAVIYMVFREKKPTESSELEKDWPYGEKLPEGKIHVKTSDVAPATSTAAEAVTTVVENKVDPVAVALDLEPMEISGTTTTKKPRKPREPKVAVKEKKPAAKKTAKKAK
jgi:hypothetical protein